MLHICSAYVATLPLVLPCNLRLLVAVVQLWIVILRLLVAVVQLWIVCSCDTVRDCVQL